MPLNPATNATFNLIAGLFFDLTGGQRGSGLFFEVRLCDHTTRSCVCRCSLHTPSLHWILYSVPLLALFELAHA